MGYTSRVFWAGGPWSRPEDALFQTLWNVAQGTRRTRTISLIFLARRAFLNAKDGSEAPGPCFRPFLEGLHRIVVV